MKKKYKPLLKGDRFGRLTIIREVDTVKGIRHYECLCDCGKITYPNRPRLLKGQTKSCGCLRADKARETHTKHGHTAKNGRVMSPTYVSWLKMKQRCNNPKAWKAHKDKQYPKKWEKFEGFLEDMGVKPKGHVFALIDPKKDYSKNNCEYIPRKEFYELQKLIK